MTDIGGDEGVYLSDVQVRAALTEGRSYLTRRQLLDAVERALNQDEPMLVGQQVSPLGIAAPTVAGIMDVWGQARDGRADVDIYVFMSVAYYLEAENHISR